MLELGSHNETEIESWAHILAHSSHMALRLVIADMRQRLATALAVPQPDLDAQDDEDHPSAPHAAVAAVADTDAPRVSAGAASPLSKRSSRSAPLPAASSHATDGEPFALPTLPTASRTQIHVAQSEK